jgi:hypothetical protein
VEGGGGPHGGESWAEIVDGRVDLLPLELHADFDEIKRVSGTACNDGSNAAFGETLETHLFFFLFLSFL